MRPLRHAALARRRALLAALALLAASGCSEKPFPNVFVWDFARGLPVRRASLVGVVLSRGEIVVVGHDRPETAVQFVPLAFVKSGGTWTYQQLPAPAIGGSVQLGGATSAEDGSVWACGRVADSELEPSHFFPVVYRRLGATWSEVPITGLGLLDDVQPAACVASGAGARFELRIVGNAAFARTGAALRYAGGQWFHDPLPDPGTGGNAWTLSALGRAPNGTWLAAGTIFGGASGVLFTDTGSGWRTLATPGGYPQLGFTGIDFDEQGTAWLTANYAAGDSTQGVLFRYANGDFSPTPIARKSTGVYQLHGISFDAEGHGWAVGGRSGYLPFLAGTNAQGGWSEELGEVDPQDLLPGSTETFGGDLFAARVAAADFAVAVGFKSVVDFKGLLESEVIIYERIPRPAGEIDALTPPVAPVTTAATRAP